MAEMRFARAERLARRAIGNNRQHALIILYRTFVFDRARASRIVTSVPLPQYFAIKRQRIRIDTPLLWGRLRDFRTGRKCRSSQRAKHFECRTVRMKPRHSGEHCDDRVTRIRSGSEIAKIPIRSLPAPAPSPESERGYRHDRELCGCNNVA
jgi:hypothetical protein